MKFVKDVRKQLCQIMQKIAKGRYYTYIFCLHFLCSFFLLYFFEALQIIVYAASVSPLGFKTDHH